MKIKELIYQLLVFDPDGEIAIKAIADSYNNAMPIETAYKSTYENLYVLIPEMPLIASSDIHG